MHRYPQIVDYNEAIQNPETAFIDPELRIAQVRENALGLPLVLSGGFALTYMLIAGERKLAVRCFHRHIPLIEQKYAAISRSFRSLNSPYFVGFEFLGDGIRVHGERYPVVKMDWVEGDTLGPWLERNHANPEALSQARRQFATLAEYLENQSISHGDIQNGNVIMSPAGIRLVDYDGVYVPGMPCGAGNESGHKHFQHPERTAQHHGPEVDRFSFIALDISLAALIEQPSLFQRYREGGETILFRANDFADPNGSEIFSRLLQMPALGIAAGQFAAICKGPIEQVPPLRDFLAFEKPPVEASAPATTKPTRQNTYIGAYPVVGASDFTAVMNHVGQRVELIGRIAEVQSGSGKGGRRHGHPYLRVNFCRHWRNIVRLILWSEDRDAEIVRRDWVGRWVSAIGLIDQPFVTDAFLVPRTEVGVTLDDANQLNFLSAEGAEYRLAAPDVDASPMESMLNVGPSHAGPSSSTPNNRQLVAQLLVKKRQTSIAQNVPAISLLSRNANHRVVNRHPWQGVSGSPTGGPRTRIDRQRPESLRRGRSPVMVLHPRPSGSPLPSAPAPSPSKPSSKPPGFMGLILRKLGLLH